MHNFVCIYSEIFEALFSIPPPTSATMTTNTLPLNDINTASDHPILPETSHTPSVTTQLPVSINTLVHQTGLLND